MKLDTLNISDEIVALLRMTKALSDYQVSESLAVIQEMLGASGEEQLEKLAILCDTDGGKKPEMLLTWMLCALCTLRIAAKLRNAGVTVSGQDGETLQ